MGPPRRVLEKPARQQELPEGGDRFWRNDRAGVKEYAGVACVGLLISLTNVEYYYTIVIISNPCPGVCSPLAA